MAAAKGAETAPAIYRLPLCLDDAHGKLATIAIHAKHVAVDNTLNAIDAGPWVDYVSILIMNDGDVGLRGLWKEVKHIKRIRPQKQPRMTLDLLSQSRSYMSSLCEDNGPRLETPLLDNQLYERALANFFEQLHAIPMFSFLHRVSLVQRFQAGVTDEPVLLAITGLAFLLTDMGTSAEDDGTAYIDRAEFLASQSLEQPSVLTVQTLVLVIGHRMFCHRFSSAFTLVGVAVRLAMWLRLNVEKLEMCFLAREACRRLMWSLFVLDKMLTGGYRDFLMCSAELMRIQLPCPDRNFELDLPREEEFLLQSREQLVEREPSPWTFYIRVMHLRHDVLQFSKSAASISPTTPEDVGSHIEAMKRCLDDFASVIPPSFRFSQSNLALRAYSSELWPFLMTHLVLHSSYCILHRDRIYRTLCFPMR
ncbi:hypothetical protein TCE0_022r06428 [Talaromyces pinophilus]|uniref:Xylanolytic transcriptional activator regulatory domain-containing protein n=1 Tax=Talaromyces pinophilus TaxID=128442 RepID=A0A6V8H8D7_TALPI|nr:hypothetical protein TCE0_022r06428 [Talaromyces pinophilus]